MRERKPFFCGFFVGAMYTDAAALAFGFAEAALLRVTPLRGSSLVYRSFIGLRWVMMLLDGLLFGRALPRRAVRPNGAACSQCKREARRRTSCP